MNAKLILVGLLFVLPGGLALMADEVRRDSGKASSGVDHSAAAPGGKTTPIIYTPPLRGAPRTRVGGATRGRGEQAATVSVLAPDHTGYTGDPQPTLYWHLTKPMTARLEIAIINDQDIDPVMEMVMDSAVQPGINRLSLEQHAVELIAGVSYQWSVALVKDPERRSGDVVASGRIRWVALPQALKTELARASEYQRVMIYARAGYWYDAFDQLSRLIDLNPDDQGLVQGRVSLLEQVGLDAVVSDQSSRTDRLK